MPFNPETMGVYNTQNPTHRQVVLDKTRELEKAYTELSATDKWILGGGMLALIGAAPLIPLTWVMTITGAAVSAWNMKGRGELSAAHQRALEDAVTVYHWCFEGTDVTQVLRYKELQDLTLLLAPLLPTKDWVKWERQKLLEIASDEGVTDRVSRQVAHVARGTVNSLWQKGMSWVGRGSEEQAIPLPVSDTPCSTKENAVFIAKVDAVEKTSMLGNVTFKVYGYKQSLNPLALLSLSNTVKEQIVKTGMKAVAQATTANNP